ncbi:MAG: hypothetical protein ACLVHV_04850 [Oscillospiraceae bacterium]
MEFWKMNGAGNDFIIIDNRSLEAGPDQLGRMAAGSLPPPVFHWGRRPHGCGACRAGRGLQNAIFQLRRLCG